MTSETVTMISAADAKAKLDAEEAVVIDVRMPYDWAGGRIHGSINLPNKAIQFRRAEVPEGKELIFYGANTARGSQAAQMAIELGFSNVFVMEDGYEGWLSAGLPTESITGTT